jgi:hypothetical protein
MPRRTLPILLALIAAIAAGVVWIWVSVIGSAPATRSIASAPEISTSREETALDPSLEPPPSSGSTSPSAPAPDAAPPAHFVERRETAALPPGDLELRDALWVAGHVVLPSGIPADEHVEIVADGGAFESRPLHRSPIAADGSFRVAFAPGTVLGTLDLVAEYLYVDQTTTVSPANPARDILITPRLGGRIHGRIVLAPALIPLRASIVGSSAEARRPSGGFVRSGKIDSDLEFDLAGVPPGSNYEIGILALGVGSAPLSGVQVERGRTRIVEIVPDLAAPVTGVVVAPDGTAANLAHVQARALETDSDADWHRARTDDAVSDASGRFAFPDLPPGEWNLTAKAQGFAESLPRRVQLDAGRSVEGLRLTLRRAGRIAGRVLGSDGEPAVLAGVSVRPSPLVRDDTFRTTDAHGDFAFDGLSPGEYRIDVGWSDPSRGGELTRSGIALAEGGCVEDLVLRIERPCRIEGRVIGEDGSPAAGVSVSASEAETGIPRSNFARTDESGAFTLERLPPDEYLIVVHDGRLAQVGETRLALRPGEVVQTELSVRAGTMLSVRLEGFGNDRSAVAVLVRDERGTIVAHAPEERSAGAAESPGALLLTIGPILPGKYVVEAVAAEKRASQAVTLSGQATESVRLSAGP